MAPKILVVLTSVDKMPTTGNPSGWYLPEFAHPYDVLAPHAEIVVASPKGGVAPLDPGSVEMFKEDASCSAFVKSKSELWEKTLTLASFRGRASEFAALFYPGGHGPMFDLATDADSIALIQEFAAAGKPIAAVCHGPAVLVNVPGLLKGKDVTGFSNAEEDQLGMSGAMPFLLEDKIKEAGGQYIKADEPFGVKVISADGGKLITGQNPASSKEIGEALLKTIQS